MKKLFNKNYLIMAAAPMVVMGVILCSIKMVYKEEN